MNESSDWNNITTKPPESCNCKETQADCPDGIYNIGCLTALKDKIRTWGVILGGIAIGLAFFEVKL